MQYANARTLGLSIPATDVDKMKVDTNGVH